MGWNPFSSGETRSDAIRAGTAVPTRSERQLCWAARDAYFACLDANGIDDPLKDPAHADRVACKPQAQQFDIDCSAAWVTYFKQWRIADLQKRRRLDELRRQGAQEMTVTTSFAPEGGAAEKGKSKEDIQQMLERQQRR
jgi:cytochrome c oxidase assembly factor 6